MRTTQDSGCGKGNEGTRSGHVVGKCMMMTRRRRSFTSVLSGVNSAMESSPSALDTVAGACHVKSTTKRHVSLRSAPALLSASSCFRSGLVFCPCSCSFFILVYQTFCTVLLTRRNHSCCQGRRLCIHSRRPDFQGLSPADASRIAVPRHPRRHGRCVADVARLFARGLFYLLLLCLSFLMAQLILKFRQLHLLVFSSQIKAEMVVRTKKFILG